MPANKAVNSQNGAKNKKVVKKTKQTVNVNVVVNSNNKRKVVSSGKAQQPQTVYVPSSSSQHTPVILKSESQSYPATQTDIDSYIETQVKKYAPKAKTLASKTEPEKQLVESAKTHLKSDVSGVHEEIPHEEKLTPAEVKPHKHLLEPRSVAPSPYELPEPRDMGYTTDWATSLSSSSKKKYDFLTDSEAGQSILPSDSEVSRTPSRPTSARLLAETASPRLTRAQSLFTLSEASVRTAGTQTDKVKRRRAGQASMINFMRAYDIPIRNTNLSAMKQVLIEKNLLDAYYENKRPQRTPRRQQKAGTSRNISEP